MLNVLLYDGLALFQIWTTVFSFLYTNWHFMNSI